MEIKRFFIDNSKAYDNYIIIDGEEFVHMTKVLRYKVGYELIVCLNDGLDYHCTLVSIDKKEAKARIDLVEKNFALPNVKINLYQAMPKGDKLDLITQKCVELGVGSITPFLSTYTNETKFRKDRLQKIALEACKQCKRAKLPEIGDLTDFKSVIDNLDEDVIIMPYENAQVGKISNIRNLKSAKSVAIIIGSEGGFSKEEVLYAKKKKAKIVSLGNRILRCETAAIVTQTLVMYELGELSK